MTSLTVWGVTFSIFDLIGLLSLHNRGQGLSPPWFSNRQASPFLISILVLYCSCMLQGKIHATWWRRAPPQLCFYSVLFCYLFWTFLNHAPYPSEPNSIQCDGVKLLHVRLLEDSTFSPRPMNNGEYPWLGLPVAVPGERRRRRKGGLRALVLVRLRKRDNQLPLLSILLANVQSLDNKLDEFRSRMGFQRNVKNWNVMALAVNCLWSSCCFHWYCSSATDMPEGSFSQRVLPHGAQNVVIGLLLSSRQHCRNASHASTSVKICAFDNVYSASSNVGMR